MTREELLKVKKGELLTCHVGVGRIRIVEHNPESVLNYCYYAIAMQFKFKEVSRTKLSDFDKLVSQEESRHQKALNAIENLKSKFELAK